MVTPKPTVSVVIAAAGAADTLPLALDAVEAQDYEAVVDVVVAAADQATRAAASRDGVVVVDNPTGRTPVGLNLAVKRSTGEIVARVDAHSVIPESYLAEAVEALVETGADNVGGMQVPQGRSFWERAVSVAMKSKLGAGDARYRIGGRAGPAETVYLGVYRRSTLERLGGFDESFTRNQDYELNHRIREAGGLVWFDPGLRVGYRPRGSLAGIAGQYFQYGVWKRRFAQVHGSLRARQLAPPALVLVLTAATVGAVFWPWFATVPLVYFAALVLAGLVAVPEAGAPALAAPLVLMTMHLSWGLGFLIGQRRAS